MTSGNIFMVCVDGSDAAIWAVKTAGRLAAAKEDSTLHLVHVVPFFDVPEGYAEKAKVVLRWYTSLPANLSPGVSS